VHFLPVHAEKEHLFHFDIGERRILSAQSEASAIAREREHGGHHVYPFERRQVTKELGFRLLRLWST